MPVSVCLCVLAFLWRACVCMFLCVCLTLCVFVRVFVRA